MAFTLLALVSLLAIQSVNAHGFLYSIDGSVSNVRGIELLNTEIDALRNPTTVLCHGLPVSATRTPLTIGSSMTLTLAISRLAIHVGYCWVEVDGVIISPTVDCVSQLRVGCPLVPGAVTADMCLQEWTFDTVNRDQISCTDCVFRWIWKATHLSVTNPEPFENCWDIMLSGGSASVGGGAGSSSGTSGGTTVPSTDSSTYVSATTSSNTTTSQSGQQTVFYALAGDVNQFSGSQGSTSQRSY